MSASGCEPTSGVISLGVRFLLESGCECRDFWKLPALGPVTAPKRTPRIYDAEVGF